MLDLFDFDNQRFRLILINKNKLLWIKFYFIIYVKKCFI